MNAAKLAFSMHRIINGKLMINSKFKLFVAIIAVAASVAANAQLMECDTISIETYMTIGDGGGKQQCNGKCAKLSIGLSSCTKDEAAYFCKKDISDEAYIETRIYTIDRATATATGNTYLKKRSSGNETTNVYRYTNCRISTAKPKL